MANANSGNCSTPCKWEHRGGLGPLVCAPTDDLPLCYSNGLQEANVSPIHDAALASATKKINKILAAIPPDENGTGASIVHTGSGIMLARVKHGRKPSTNKKTIDNSADPVRIKAALGLK